MRHVYVFKRYFFGIGWLGCPSCTENQRCPARVDIFFGIPATLSHDLLRKEGMEQWQIFLIVGCFAVLLLCGALLAWKYGAGFLRSDRPHEMRETSHPTMEMTNMQGPPASFQGMPPSYQAPPSYNQAPPSFNHPGVPPAYYQGAPPNFR